MTRILASLFLLCAVTANAQQPFWTQTNGPSGGGSQFGFNSNGYIYNLGRYLLRSTDDGTSWKNITPAFYQYGQSLATSAQDHLYILASGSLYRSKDNGDSWEVVLKDAGYGTVYTSKLGPVFVLNNNSTVLWRSLDEGNTWVKLTTGLPKTNMFFYFSLTPTGKLIFLEYESTHFFYSTNNGDSWTEQSTLPYRFHASIQGTKNSYLFCSSAGPDSATSAYGDGIRSTDNGKSWAHIESPYSITITSNDILSGSLYSGDSLKYSTDYGTTWQYSKLPDARTIFNSNNYPDQKGNIYWSLADRASRYSTATKKAEEISLPISSVNTILINRDESLIVNGATFFSVSKNIGQSWVSETGLDDSLFIGKFYAFAKDSSGGYIALGPNGFGFFRSLDFGTSWTQLYLLHFYGAPNEYISDHKLITAPNGNIFLCNTDSIIQRSSDLGKSWLAVSAGLQSDISGISCDPTGILYSFGGQNIYRSLDNGNSWQFMVNIIDPFLFSHIVTTSNISSLVATSKGEIFAGTTKDGVIFSNDSGKTWKVINENLATPIIFSFFAAPNGDVFGISSYGKPTYDRSIIYRPYQGNRWFKANDGLGYTGDLQTMAFASDGTAYLGTGGRGVWKSNATVNAVHTTLPSTEKITLTISPNPASTQATLSYSLPSRDLVKIELCDVLGRTVRTIANEVQDSGEHLMNITLDDIFSGTYFLRISGSNVSVNEKFVLNR